MVDALKSVLESYSFETLLTILNYHGVSLMGKRSKQQVVSALVELFSSSDHVQKMLSRLGPAGREVIDLLLRKGGKASCFAIQHLLEGMKLIDFDSRRPSSLYPVNKNTPYRNPQSRNLEEILANLTALGLVFASPSQDETEQVSMSGFHLAQEYLILQSMLRFFPAPSKQPSWQPKYIAAPAQTYEGSARVFQRDLYLYWAYVERNQVELISKGIVAKRHLVALNNVLIHKETIATGQSETDLLRLFFLRGLLTELGLLEVIGFQLRARPAGDFLALNPAERIKRCLGKYAACRGMNELLWFLSIIPNSYQKLPLPAPDLLVKARRSVLSFVKLATNWIKIDALIQNIQINHYEFLFERGYRQKRTYYTPPHPYSAYTNPLEWDFPGITQEGSGWNQVEGELIRTIIQGPLHWMGLVDLAASDQKQTEPDAFRLTQVGAWLLADAAKPEIPQVGGQVIVQPDFTITALDPVNDHTLYTLERFAQRLSAERAVTLRLTQQNVYSAQQQGWDATRIQQYLESLTEQPLPGNVARSLQEWQERYQRITILPGLTLLHAEDAQELEELAKDAALKDLLAQQPTPGLAILPEILPTKDAQKPATAALPAPALNEQTREVNQLSPKNQERSPMVDRAVALLVDLLYERDWPPVIEYTPDKLPPGCLRVDESGKLSVTHPPASLYLRAFIASLADPDADGSFRLTRQSVQRAVRGGLSAPDIIQELNQVLVEPLPGAVEKRIIAWTGHLGAVRLDPAALLQFKDEKTQRELLSDPELGPYLHTIKPNDMRTQVWVEAANLERVLALLEERGAEIKRRS